MSSIPPVILLLLAYFFKELIFTALIPMWHTPDEQAHFAQVAYFAEFGKMPSTAPDLNREIFESEKLLGTLRDSNGNNKFTYHPEYKIQYTNSYIGKYENEINNFPREYRQELVKQEAANYPPLYYWISSVPYKFFYNSGLITRVFVLRMISVLMGVGMVYFVFLIGKIIFSKNTLYQYTLVILVAFQPMFSFVSAGITSDNLTNLFFTIVIYCGFLVLKNGIKKNSIFLFISILFLLYLTKPQFILALPIFLTALIIKLLLSKAFLLTKILLTTLFGLVLLALAININNPAIYQLLEKVYPQSFFPGKALFSVNSVEFLKISLNRIIHETIPWYWGVFDWLGVVMPIEVIRILNRLMILAGTGILIKLFLMLRKRNREDWYFLYLILISLIYFGGILLWDFIYYQSHYFSFGLQGRYFFPTIIAHMAIFLVGLVTLVPKKLAVIKEIWTKLIAVGMMTLNFLALWIILKIYYDLSNLNAFIIESSQYKPWFFKGGMLIFWIIAYFIILCLFLYRFLRLKLVKP